MRLILIDDEENMVGQIENVEDFDLTKQSDRTKLTDEVQELIEPFK